MADTMTNGNAPASVVLAADEMRVAFTPRELNMIRDHFGRSWRRIMEDEDSDDLFIVIAWLKLRRDGFDGGPDAMLDTVIDIEGAPDPTNVKPPTISRHFAGIGE